MYKETSGEKKEIMHEHALSSSQAVCVRNISRPHLGEVCTCRKAKVLDALRKVPFQKLAPLLLALTRRPRQI